MPAHASASPVTREFRVGDRRVRLLGSNVPASRADAVAIEVDIGGAVDAVQAFWGTDWTRDIAMVAAGTDEEFRAAAGGGPASRWADIAAVTVADRVDPARRLAIGERIVFAPGAAAMSEKSLRIVLTHELFHYAARADTALDAPRWLTEGVADFVARPPTPVPVDALPVPLALPSDADLDTPGRSARRATTARGGSPASWPTPTGRRSCANCIVATCGVTHIDCPSRCTTCWATTRRSCSCAGISGRATSLTQVSRVLLVTNDFPPRRGGIQSYLGEFVSRLVGRGHTTSRCTRRSGRAPTTSMRRPAIA